MIDFPASPTVGQTFSAAGVTWTWDGSKWLPSGLAPTVVGGINDNRIINGDMRIDARNNGSSGTGIGYTVDRWNYTGTQASKGTWIRNPMGSYLQGHGYNLGFTSSSSYSVLTADHFEFRQPIEADVISDFAWGTANAQPVTLSFWVYSSLIGTFSGSLSNLTRAYPFVYSIPAANTWTRIVVTIPGDTSGTWTLSGNGIGVYLFFSLGVGATYAGTAGAWASADYRGATGSVSVVATNGATFYLTGVKLEIGSVATPFNRQSMAKSLADCQRYYTSLVSLITSGYSVSASGTVYAGFSLPVTMRATPTLAFSGISYGNASALTAGAISPTAYYTSLTITAAGQGYAIHTANLTAEL